MSAKPAKKNAKKNPQPAAQTPMTAASSFPASATAAGAAPVPFLESADPRRRLVGRVVIVGVWVYVAALWLLALDQTFNWGIFGPKVPALP